VCRIGVAGPFAVESLSPHRTLAVGWNDELIDLQRKGVAELQAGTPQNVASVSLENLRSTSVQQSSKQDRISFAGLTGWAGKDVCAEGRFLQGTQGR
jgi:adenine-specific DNA-methyltransferase